MSKIIYIGKFKKSSTSTEASVVAAMRTLGHEVTCVDYLNEPVSPHMVAEYDLALFAKCEPIPAETIKMCACRKAMWIFDSLHDTTMETLRKGAEALVEKGKLMDCLFTAAPGDVETYRDMGCCEVRYLPQACDNRIFRNRGLDRDLEITFVGNNYGSHRLGVVRRVYERYGGRFKLFSKTDTWGVPVERALVQEDMAKIFSRSKITLNMSETPEDDKWSRRVWDAMACGAVVAAQCCPSFANFFTDHEIVTWTDVPDLFDEIDGLLADAEILEEISRRASGLVLNHHTYKHRVKELLSIMGIGGSKCES